MESKQKSSVNVFVDSCFREKLMSLVYRRSLVQQRGISLASLQKKALFFIHLSAYQLIMSWHFSRLPTGSPGKLFSADCESAYWLWRHAKNWLHVFGGHAPPAHMVRASERKLRQSAKVVNKGLLSTLSNWLPCCLLSPAFNLSRSTVNRGSYYGWLYQYCNEALWYQLTTAWHRSPSMHLELKQ